MALSLSMFHTRGCFGQNDNTRVRVNMYAQLRLVLPLRRAVWSVEAIFHTHIAHVSAISKLEAVVCCRMLVCRLKSSRSLDAEQTPS
jgi:hypothetical protein